MDINQLEQAKGRTVECDRIDKIDKIHQHLQLHTYLTSTTPF